MKSKAKLTPQEIKMLPDNAVILGVRDEVWEEFLESRKQLHSMIRQKKPKFFTIKQSIKHLTNHYEKAKEKEE